MLLSTSKFYLAQAYLVSRTIPQVKNRAPLKKYILAAKNSVLHKLKFKKNVELIDF